LSVCEQAYTIFVKTYTIMDYTYEKNPLNFGTDLTQSGRMGATSDFRWYIWILHILWTFARRRLRIAYASCGGGMCSGECLLAGSASL